MLSIVVVLPAPLRPTRQTTSSLDAQRHAVEDVGGAAIGVDGVHLEHGRHSLSREGVGTGGAEQDHRDLVVPSDLVRRSLSEHGALMHRNDAVGVSEHNIHVVLDDHGRDAFAAHDGGNRVHDLALVPRADPARRLVEEEQLRPERIGERHVEQLALALREVAGLHVALARKPELLEHRVGLGAHVAVKMRERGHVAALALAGEDRERHVFESGKVVEKVHELEAAGDARLHELGHGGPGDVPAVEKDLPEFGA